MSLGVRPGEMHDGVRVGPFGMQEGMCTREYKPVCAYNEVYGEHYTFNNECESNMYGYRENIDRTSGCIYLDPIESIGPIGPGGTQPGQGGGLEYIQMLPGDMGVFSTMVPDISRECQNYHREMSNIGSEVSSMVLSSLLTPTDPLQVKQEAERLTRDMELVHHRNDQGKKCSEEFHQGFCEYLSEMTKDNNASNRIASFVYILNALGEVYGSVAVEHMDIMVHTFNRVVSAPSNGKIPPLTLRLRGYNNGFTRNRIVMIVIALFVFLMIGVAIGYLMLNSAKSSGVYGSL